MHLCIEYEAYMFYMYAYLYVHIHIDVKNADPKNKKRAFYGKNEKR